MFNHNGSGISAAALAGFNYQANQLCHRNRGDYSWADLNGFRSDSGAYFATQSSGTSKGKMDRDRDRPCRLSSE